MGPLRAHLCLLARPTGFEPVTPAFGGQYSIQLSYGRFIFELSQIPYVLDTENLARADREDHGRFRRHCRGLLPL